MEIVEKAKAALAEKRDAVKETVGGAIDRGKEVAHHLVDKLASVVHRGEHAVEAAPAAEPSVRVSKRPGEKKPRAARRRARRVSRAHA